MLIGNTDLTRGVTTSNEYVMKFFVLKSHLQKTQVSMETFFFELA